MWTPTFRKPQNHFRCSGALKAQKNGLFRVLCLHSAVIAAVLIGSDTVHAGEENSVYQGNLTALTDDPAYQEYLRNLKRNMANAALIDNQTASQTSVAAQQPRVIQFSADGAQPTPDNPTGRFTFTRLPSDQQPLAPTEQAIRTDQIEQLRQSAAGSNTQ